MKKLTFEQHILCYHNQIIKFSKLCLFVTGLISPLIVKNTQILGEKFSNFLKIFLFRAYF
jgi:hypothetical protein